jgi:hypothetical protein
MIRFLKVTALWSYQHKTTVRQNKHAIIRQIYSGQMMCACLLVLGKYFYVKCTTTHRNTFFRLRSIINTVIF